MELAAKNVLYKSVMNMKTKHDYINYFEHMEEEDKKCPLGGMAWDDIVWWVHNAVEVDKLFTVDELKEMFPYLFG